MKKRELSFVIVFILLLFGHNSYSQLVNCKKLLKWTEVTKQEFPNVDFYRTRANSREFKQVVFNLYSDKYFVPVFGKPFDELSTIRRNFYSNNLKKCKSKKKYYNIITWQASSLLRPFNQHQRGTYSTTNIINEVKKIRKIRNEYQNAVEQLRVNTDLTYDQWKTYKRKLNYDFAILFPSKVKRISELIDAQERLVSKRKIEQLVGQEMGKPNTRETLYSLRAFESRNSKLFRVIDQADREFFINELNTKKAIVLDDLMKTENLKIQNLGDGVSDIQKLNNHYKSFSKRYDLFKSNHAVRVTQESYIMKKTEMVKTRTSEIENMITSSNSKNELDKIERIYLNGTDSKTRMITLLKELIVAQDGLIKNRKAYAEAKQKEEQLRTYNNYLKKALIRSKTKMSDQDKISLLNAYKTKMNLNSNKKLYAEDLRLLKNYIENNNVDVYLVNESKGTCRKVYPNLISTDSKSRFSYFKTKDDPESRFAYTNGAVEYSFLPRVRKIVNSNAWQIAKRCSSVKRHLEDPRKSYFKVNSVLYNESLDIPILWTSKLTSNYTYEFAVYSDCRINSRRTARSGSQVFSFILTKELAEAMVRDLDIASKCED